MQNIGAAALFMPVTFRIILQLDIPVSRLLMPMEFCAIIGSCLTLFGSSPLILLNDLMGKWYIGKIFELEVPETFRVQNDPVSITNLNSHYFVLNL